MLRRVGPLIVSTDLVTRLSRRQFLAAGAALPVLVTAACKPIERPPDMERPDAENESSPAPPLPTLRQRLGQMALVGFRGTSLETAPSAMTDVRDHAVGGVVLFTYDVARGDGVRNVVSPSQVAALTAALQQTAHLPLIVAADQEGGRVARLDPARGFPATYAAQHLGERGDPEFTYAQSHQMARTLKEAGVNHNFAPVVDVNTNPANPVIGSIGRSFSAEPAVVTEQAAAFIRGHRAVGVTTTLKHFPGHGSSRHDSHLGFVDVTDTWQELELEPYRELIGRGLVDAVMTAHVFNAKLDPELPATLSAPILTGILREQLGFDGVVFSDDMQMAAIAAHYDFAEAVVLAVEAGVDVLTVGNNICLDRLVAAEIIDALEQAVLAGRIREERINASYRRIMALKAKWPRAQDNFQETRSGVVGESVPGARLSRPALPARVWRGP